MTFSRKMIERRSSGKAVIKRWKEDWALVLCEAFFFPLRSKAKSDYRFRKNQYTYTFPQRYPTLTKKM